MGGKGDYTMTTVKQLIETLQQLDPDAMVLVDRDGNYNIEDITPIVGQAVKYGTPEVGFFPPEGKDVIEDHIDWLNSEMDDGVGNIEVVSAVVL